jgi:hypothetical protein
MQRDKQFIKMRVPSHGRSSVATHGLLPIPINPKGSSQSRSLDSLFTTSSGRKPSISSITGRKSEAKIDAYIDGLDPRGRRAVFDTAISRKPPIGNPKVVWKMNQSKEMASSQQKCKKDLPITEYDKLMSGATIFN